MRVPRVSRPGVIRLAASAFAANVFGAAADQLLAALISLRSQPRPSSWSCLACHATLHFAAGIERGRPAHLSCIELANAMAIRRGTVQTRSVAETTARADTIWGTLTITRRSSPR